jgi:parallel beta-helix repeat protein/putative cofactor-binding repeat protein
MWTTGAEKGKSKNRKVRRETMKHMRLLLACASGMLLVLAILIGLNLDTAVAAPSATYRYVLGDGGANSSNCTNPNTPCKSIQYALNQAATGDIIRVAKGNALFTYAETVAIDKSMTLEGGWGAVGFPGGYLWQRSSPCDPSWTTIDAGGAGRVISITGNITPTVDCFTITGGDAAGLGGDPGTTVDNDAGGGIYSRDAAPIITNNVITGNYGCDTCPASYGRGGGIYLLDAPATAVISNNLIAYNVADESTWGQGGGIMLRDSDAPVLSNTIEYNRAGHSAGYGGGIAVRGGSPVIANNTVVSNRAGQSVQGLGGGIFVQSSTPVTIELNLLQNNMAISGAGDAALISRGGGIYFAGDPTGIAVIRDNTFRWNIASPVSPQHGEGGGIYLDHVVVPSVVSGNLIDDNYSGFNDAGNGGGIYANQSRLDVIDNDIVDNNATWTGDHGEGGGLYVNGGSVLIQSNVISNNHGAGFGGFPSTSTGYGGGMAISGSLTIVQDNWIVGNDGTNGENLGVGGGIYGFWGALHIEGNTIVKNRATGHNLGLGGGLYLEQTLPTLEGNTILDNVAAGGSTGRGGGVRINNCSTFTLTNNIIARNEASERGSGIAVAANSVGDVAHNTIADNSSGDGVGVYVNLTSDVALINNIVVSHTTGIVNADLAGSTISADYTLFEANTSNYGAGVSSSHEIAGPARLRADYHLRGDSNGIDQGVVLAWVTDDIDGDPRIYGTAPDVGADEISCLARVGGTTFTAIQAAVDAATPGQTVQVARGTCYEHVSIAQSVTLEGGWNIGFSSRDADPASASAIDGMGSGRPISITEKGSAIAVTVDGFTITGGDATGLGGTSGYKYDLGGGIYSWYADLTVANCVVTDNVASTAGIAWGGGIGTYGGSVTLEDSTLANNVASTASSGYGGGACLRFGSASLTGNVIEGNTASPVGHGYGGGLWLANNSSMLVSNTIRDNTATPSLTGYGGGVEVRYGSASLTGDVIEGNRAVLSGLNGFGGGIAARDGALLTVDGVQIHDNSSTFGGGIYVNDGDDAVLSGTLIFSNTAGMGGGVYVITSTDVSLTGNQVYANAADYGGGILLSGSDDATLAGNYIHDNAAWGLGGGLWISGCDSARLTNNIIVENRLTHSGNGAGICLFLNSTAHFEHTTLARNSGGDGTGLYIVDSSQAWMTNTIVASHTVGIYVNSGCVLNLEATLWGDGAWANVTNRDGSGTIDDGEIIIVGDPGFVDPDGANLDDWDDYHIDHLSEAKDAGLDVGVATDIDGDARPIGSNVDIGADEAWCVVFLPLVSRGS